MKVSPPHFVDFANTSTKHAEPYIVMYLVKVFVNSTTFQITFKMKCSSLNMFDVCSLFSKGINIKRFTGIPNQLQSLMVLIDLGRCELHRLVSLKQLMGNIYV